MSNIEEESKTQDTDIKSNSTDVSSASRPVRKKSNAKYGVILLVFFSVIGIGSLVINNGRLGAFVKNNINNYVPQMTKSDANVEKVTVAPFRGFLELEQFLIGNPEGFKSDYAIKFDQFRFDMDVTSLTRQKIHIEEIYIKNPEIIYEGLWGDSNFDVLIQNIEEYTGFAGNIEEEQEESKDPDAVEDQKELMIDRLIIEDATVSIASTMLGGRKVSFTIPSIEIQNIGKEEPVTFAELIVIILETLLNSIKEPLANVLDSTTEGGKTLMNSLKGLFK